LDDLLDPEKGLERYRRLESEKASVVAKEKTRQDALQDQMMLIDYREQVRPPPDASRSPEFEMDKLRLRSLNDEISQAKKDLSDPMKVSSPEDVDKQKVALKRMQMEEFKLRSKYASQRNSSDPIAMRKPVDQVAKTPMAAQPAKPVASETQMRAVAKGDMGQLSQQRLLKDIQAATEALPKVSNVQARADLIKHIDDMTLLYKDSAQPNR